MNDCYPFCNTPLPYGYDALEPFIDEKTMHLHHDKHLQTYIENLNNQLKDQEMLQKWTLEEFLMKWCTLEPELQIPIRNNAGGIYNHRFYFAGMAPASEKTLSGPLLKKIERQFGSMTNFRSLFKQAALSVFGSGYAWLVLEQGRLKIITTANQNVPMLRFQCPLLCIDVWEHAYYLKHYNKRADYIDDWFDVVNWDETLKRYMKAL